MGLKKVSKNRVRKFNTIFISVWLIGFMYILITIALNNGFKNSSEVNEVYQEILKYADRNETEIYLNEMKITNVDEKKLILKLFTGEDYEINPIQVYVEGDINEMQEIRVKLKRFNQEKIIKIYQNFTCSKSNKNEEYIDESGNYCDMSVIMKLEYKNQEKTFGLYATDEVMDVLKKYRKEKTNAKTDIK